MTDPTQVSPALYAICFVLGLLPVLSFLLALVGLDSYKLVRLRWVLVQIAAGCGVALACMKLNPWLIDAFGIDVDQFVRFEAPILEEVLKGLVVYLAIRTHRVGFLVDAAIFGFAVGAGFAAVENIHYFLVLERPSLLIWTIRGFGTAIMHGGATAILAVSSRHLTERFETNLPHVFLPGLVLASGIHSLFNHFYISPVLSTAALLVVFPMIFMLVYRVSEEATHRWLGVGFDSDQELLESIHRGELADTRVGAYLKSLRERFPPAAVADMLCLIRLHLELSIRAKGVLLMQKAGFEPPADPEVDARFEELAYLEKTIGRTGLIALEPVFNFGSKEIWQLKMLGR